MYIVCWTRPGKIHHGNSGDTIAGIAYELSLRYGVRDCTEGRKPGVGYVLGSPVSPPPFHSPMRSFIGGTKLNLASAEDAHELFDDLPLVLSTGLDGVGYTVFNVSLEYHEAD